MVTAAGEAATTVAPSSARTLLCASFPRTLRCRLIVLRVVPHGGDGVHGLGRPRDDGWSSTHPGDLLQRRRGQVQIQFMEEIPAQGEIYGSSRSRRTVSTSYPASSLPPEPIQGSSRSRRTARLQPWHRSRAWSWAHGLGAHWASRITTAAGSHESCPRKRATARGGGRGRGRRRGGGRGYACGHRLLRRRDWVIQISLLPRLNDMLCFFSLQGYEERALLWAVAASFRQVIWLIFAMWTDGMICT